MSDRRESLLERYNIISDEDKDSQNWRRILDLESPIKLESDWYSTKTFQVFLDALDINQPASLDRSRNVSKESITVKNTPKKEQTRAANETLTGDNELSKCKKHSTTKQKCKNVETILSAEALKILSELPDLSHMSATRSFMFPNNRSDGSSSNKK